MKIQCGRADEPAAVRGGAKGVREGTKNVNITLTDIIAQVMLMTWHGASRVAHRDDSLDPALLVPAEFEKDRRYRCRPLKTPI
jgi:hypothetical protein